ncbi:transposase-like protein [Paraburkholderia sp. JPY465]
MCGQRPVACFPAVLLPCVISNTYHIDISRPDTLTATEPETVTLDKSGSNLAALQAINARRNLPIEVRQKKYLNSIVEQDHRAIKRRTRPMLGFKKFRCARILLGLGGIEIMHMIRKGQMKCAGKDPSSASQQFYSLLS